MHCVRGRGDRWMCALCEREGEWGDVDVCAFCEREMEGREVGWYYWWLRECMDFGLNGLFSCGG